MKRALFGGLIMMALVALGVQTAMADQSYHTERLPLTVTDEGEAAGHTLRNGMVVNIHPNGPVNGAIEEYILNGAKPNTDYEVYWRLPGPDDNDIDIPTNFEVDGLGGDPSPLIVHTNKNGNGHCTYRVSRDWQQAAGFTDVDVVVKWVFKSDDTVVYMTDWTEVHID